MSSQPDNRSNTSQMDEEPLVAVLGPPSANENALDRACLQKLSERPGAIRALVESYSPGLLDASTEVKLMAAVSTSVETGGASDEALEEWGRVLASAAIRVINRIPIYMYLTDEREASLIDIVRSLDRDLFEKVTGLPLEHLESLMHAGIISASGMNPAIWHFRRLEMANLMYAGGKSHDEMMGLWDVVVPCIESSADAGEVFPDAIPGGSQRGISGS